MLLNDNQFTGVIPKELGKLSTLVKLYLNQNQLSGTIPETLKELVNLRNLNLGNNQLTGEIPEVLSELSLLTSLYLDHNQLTGAIPEALGGLTDLRILHLDSNQLAGPIPNELGTLYDLYSLSLSDNNLTFSDIEPVYSSAIVPIREHDVADQKAVDSNRTLPEVAELATLTITPELAKNPSGHDSYRWFRNGIEIPGATDRILTIKNIKTSDAGLYTYKVTNSIVPELILYSHNKEEGIRVHVSNTYTAVVEDIAGNADNTPASAAQINAIEGVSGAKEGIDYAAALAEGSYTDRAHPTAEEIQAVIDAKNASDLRSSPVYDENGVQLIGYVVAPQGIGSAISSRAEVNPALISEDTVIRQEIFTNGRGVITIKQPLLKLPKNVSESCMGYESYVVITETGGVQTGFRGIECVDTDPTQKNNVAFALGTKANIESTTAAEKAEHDNAEIVIIDDVMVPVGSTITIGGK